MYALQGPMTKPKSSLGAAAPADARSGEASGSPIEDQRRQADQLQAIGRLAGGVAPRSQQPAHHHQRLCSAPARGVAGRRCAGRRRQGDSGRWATRGRTDGPVAGVQSAADSPAAGRRPRIVRQPLCAEAAGPGRRAHRRQGGPGSNGAPGADRPGAVRAGACQPGDQRSRGDARVRTSDHRDGWRPARRVVRAHAPRRAGRPACDRHHQ